jgi:hypothetical protein
MRHRICRTRFLPVHLVWLPIVLAASAPRPAAAQGPEVWQAAGSWLVLLDSGDYAESWDQAAKVFQAAITPTQWARRAVAYREGSGDPTSRQLIAFVAVTDPEGVPPGEYVRLRFECQCTRRGMVRETVLMVNEGARGWRVASYAVEPAGG